ncbi:MAG: helix-turn-helix domain-containing protein [Solirubrobacteraceae bacterium]|jgi:AcrR family transcriptional regulator
MTTKTGERTLRADARRNQDRIVAAAQEAFAEHGYAAPIEEIAHRAGVGAATIYRRFPTKQLLVRAIYNARIAELEPAIAAAQDVDDPWEGALAAMRAVLASQSENMVLLQILSESGVMEELHSDVKQRVFAPLSRLFAAAQGAGQARRDIDPSELPVLIQMVAATAKHLRPGEAGGVLERYLVLLSDALRTPAPSQLPPLASLCRSHADEAPQRDQ